MPDNSSQEIGNKENFSRRDFLKLGGLGLGVLALLGYELKKSGFWDIATLSEKEKVFLENEFVRKVFAPPLEQESKTGFEYFNQTHYQVESQSDDGTVFTFKTPDNLRGKSETVIDEKKVEAGKVSLFLPAAKEFMGREEQLLSPLPPVIPSIGLWQLQAGTGTTDFTEYGLKSMHGLGLNAVGFWRLWQENKLGKVMPKGKFLDLSGYSAGANAALVLATHSHENINQLFTFSSIYDLFDLGLRNQSMAAFTTVDSKARIMLEYWMGKKTLGEVYHASNRMNDDGREQLQQIIPPLRQLMIRCSPYHWVDKIPANSFVWHISHGRKDEVTPFMQSYKLVNRLTELGWDSHHLLVNYHNGGHLTAEQ